jgi:uncharacterized membrane protein YjjP (DUF1212 family)
MITVIYILLIIALLAIAVLYLMSGDWSDIHG